MFRGLVFRCRDQGAGCRVQSVGCRVQGAGYRVQGAGVPQHHGPQHHGPLLQPLRPAHTPLSPTGFGLMAQVLGSQGLVSYSLNCRHTLPGFLTRPPPPTGLKVMNLKRRQLRCVSVDDAEPTPPEGGGPHDHLTPPKNPCESCPTPRHDSPSGGAIININGTDHSDNY